MDSRDTMITANSSADDRAAKEAPLHVAKSGAKVAISHAAEAARAS